MSRQQRSGTQCEMRVRRLLHGAGLRYRVDFRPFPEVRTRVDIGWKTIRLAVYIDGCFWHGCPEHFIAPKSNGEWWQTKLQSNRQRDQRTNALLRHYGWTVLRFWEHEPPEEVAIAIVEKHADLGPKAPKPPS